MNLDAPRLPLLPKGWIYSPLSDLVEDRGICYGVVQPGQNDVNGIPLIRVHNLKDNQINITDVLKISPEIEAKYNRSRLKGGEVLLSLVGTLGQVAVVPRELAGWNTARAVGVIPIKNEYDNRWVALCLRSKYAQHFMQIWANTTVQATLNLKDVAQIPIPIPPRDQAKHIADKASLFDNKIAINSQINETLELIAKTIFKEWFIDFGPVKAKAEGKKPFGMDDETAALFPDSFEESELGMIPTGWKVENIGSLATISSGKRPNVRENRPSQITPYPILGGGGIMGYTNNFLVENNTLATGRVGTLGKIFLINEKTWPSDNTLLIKPNETKYIYPLYFLLNKINFSALNRGSTQPLVTQSDLGNQFFPFPTSTGVAQAFHNIVSSIFEKIGANQAENKYLEELRHLLLPKLISGELDLQELP